MHNIFFTEFEHPGIDFINKKITTKIDRKSLTIQYTIRIQIEVTKHFTFNRQ